MDDIYLDYDQIAKSSKFRDLMVKYLLHYYAWSQLVGLVGGLPFIFGGVGLAGGVLAGVHLRAAAQPEHLQGAEGVAGGPVLVHQAGRVAGQGCRTRTRLLATASKSNIQFILAIYSVY